jgi:hypothetical protein
MEDNSQDVFFAMRKQLMSVRNYHRIVLWLLILAFLVFFSVSIFKLISPSQNIGDYIKAFGSAGVGGALVWFGMRVLWVNRISQLSLALFESHVHEVYFSLKEIPSDYSAEKKRSTRAEIWTIFRKGLNEIWLSENSVIKEKSSQTNGKNATEQVH